MDGSYDGIEGRLEYVPRNSPYGARSASAGRVRSMSASYSPRADGYYGDTSQRPVSAYANPSSRRRVPSAISKQGGGIVHAWTSPGEVVSDSSRKVHVQAMLKNKKPETLADDLFQTKESLFKAREELKLAQVGQRRLEAELLKTRGTLARSEELIHNKERMQGPNMTMSQLYRTPDTTHLVGNLKEQNKEVRGERDAIAEELAILQRSMRATKLSELQSEVFTCTQEMDRLQRINRVIGERLTAAEDAAQTAVGEANLANRALEEHLSGVNYLSDSPIKPLSTNSISGGSVRRTLQTMLQAHKALISQAQLLRTVFMPGLSMPEMIEKARQRPNTAGAPEVLNFLQNHVQKLSSELTGQPGHPGRLDEEKPRNSANADASRVATHSQVMDAVTKQLRKLRVLEPQDLKSKPEVGLQSEQLQELFKLYNDEVDRLNGRKPRRSRPPSASPSLAPSPPETKVTPRVVEKAPEEAAEEAVEVAKPKSATPTPEKPEPRAVTPPPEEPEPRAATPPPEEPEATAPEVAADVIPAEAPKAEAPTPPAGAVPYEVVVYTSDVSGGAFGGAVFVTFRGEKGNSSEVMLPSDRYSYDTGEANTFNVQVEDVGAIRSVDLRMEVTDSDVTWHLDKISVSNESSKGVFAFQNWVKPSTTISLFPPSTQPPVEYEVEVYTADSPGAGTDGKVYIKVVGDKGASEWVLLGGGTPSEDAFAVGKCDKFKITAADVNDLSHVMVKLASMNEATNDSLHSGWNLTRVEVLHTITGWKSTFHHNDWITRKEPIVTLLEADTWVAKTPYKVTVVTSDMKGAAFEGEVFVTFKGCWGDSSETKLLNSPGESSHSFGLGASNEFTVMSDDVGYVNSIIVRYVPGAGSNDVWGLSKLVVNPDAWWGGEFNFDGWLTAMAPQATVFKWRDTTEYKVVAFTSKDVAGASFDGDVYFTLNGEFGTTDEQILFNDSTQEGPVGKPKTLYGAESPQEFTVKAKNVGVLASVSVRIMASGTTDSWSLDRIEVTTKEENSSSGMFIHSNWLKADDSGAVTISKQLTETEYKVKVSTDEVSDPFDGDLFLTLEGVEGTTSEVKLVNDSKTPNFHANTVAEFTIKAGGVGTINGATLRITTTTSQPWWYMKRMEVTNTKTGALSFFRYNSWMNSNCIASVTLQPQTMFEYNITLKMMDGSSEPYDGSVAVTLHGSSTSDPVTFSTKAGNADFSPGAQSSVTIKCSDLGDLNNVTVKPIGATAAKVLQLDRVEVQNVSTWASSTYFPWKAGVEDGAEATPYKKTMQHYYAAVKLSTGTFDGSLALVVCGEQGDSDPVPLLYDGASPAWSADSELACDVQVFDVGAFTSIKLVAAKSGEQSVVSVERVKLCSYSTYDTTTFHLGGDIDAPGSGTLTKLEEVEYIIQLSTADVRGAGTDGYVYLALKGEKGKSNSIQLERSSDGAFQRGSMDDVTIKTTHVGKLQCACVHVSSSWWGSLPNSEWMLDHMTVLDTATGERTTFKHNGWVAGDEVELAATSTEQVYVDYQVVVTGRWSQLDYDSTLKVLGEGEEQGSGSASTLKLKTSGAVSADGPYTSTFNVRGADVGSLKSIEFTPNTTWSVNIRRIEVLNKKTQAAGLFNFLESSIYASDCPKKVVAESAEASYIIKVATAHLSGDASFEGNVFITLHGTDGNCEEKQLCCWWASGFQAGDVTDYYINGYNVGPINAITVRTDKAQASTEKWGLGYVEVQNSVTGSRATFEHQDFIAADTSVRIEHTKAMVDYEISVTTSDIRGAGTDSDVFITLSGESGHLEEVKLSNGDCNVFARGQTDKFTINGEEVGSNRSLQVRLAPGADGSDVHSQWALATIEVLNKSSGIKSVFNHNSWICVWSYTSLAEASSTQVLTTYKVAITTGDMRGADYEGDAWVIVSGYSGTTEELKLVKPGHVHSSFRRSETETFTVRGIDVGYVSTINFRMEPTASDPNWFVDKVTVENTSTTNTNSGNFLVSTWLDTDKKSVSVYREQLLTEYSVEVYSTDVEGAGAGFDGDVEIVLHGRYGDAPDKDLVNETPTFPPGSCESFIVKVGDVGMLSSIDLRARKTGKKTSLSVDRVVITDVATSRSWNFMSKDAEGAVVPSILTAVAAGGADALVTLKRDVALVKYKVVVTTSNMPDPAFDGSAYIIFNGTDGAPEELQLLNSSESNYKAGSNSEFSLKVPDFGQVSYMIVRTDFTGASTQWHLDKVTVINEETGATTICKYGSYLNADCTVAYLWPQSSYSWKAIVRTSDQSDAAFDGDVFIRVGNCWQQGEEHELANELGRFDASSVQEFSFKLDGVSSADYVEIRVAATGKETKWHLSTIELTCAEAESSYSFPLHGWVTEADSPLKVAGKRQYVYDLTLITAADSDPFGGSAYLVLSGTSGEAEEVRISLPEGYIRAGDVTKILAIKIPDVGYQNTGIRIRTEDATSKSSGSSSWHLDSAILTWIGTPDLFAFSAAIPAGGSQQASRLENEEFSFVLTTKDARGNGTDAQAMRVVLNGDKGSSQDIWLRSYDDHFLERGAVDTVATSASNVGVLSSVKLWLGDGSDTAIHSQWLPEKLEVIHKQSGARTTFPYSGEWISKAQAGDEPVVLTASGTDNAYVEYKVTVVTSGECEGYDGEVLMILVGADNKESQTLSLGTAAKDGLFQPGSTDKLSVSTIDMGAPASIKLNLTQVKQAWRWKLRRIELLNVKSGDMGVYRCEDVLSAWNWWTTVSTAPPVVYTLVVQTSACDEPFSGEVFLKLVGEEGSSSEQMLDLYGSPVTFTSDSSSMLSLYALDVGPVTEAVVRLGAPPGGDATKEKWALGSLEVYNTSSGAVTSFEHNQVISAGHSATLRKLWKDVEYELEVHTSDVRGAGTDALVFLTLSGDNGTADELQLVNDDPDRFSRNHTDKFVFTSKHVGANKKLTFRLAQDPSSSSPIHSGWRVQYTSLVNNDSGVKTVGNFNSWVTPDVPATVLEASSCQLLYENKLSITTSAEQEGDFQGKVHVMLNGAWGISQEDALLDAAGQPLSFAPGSKQEVVFQAEDVGPLYSISLRVEAADGGAQTWAVESIVVANSAGSSGTFKPTAGQVVDPKVAEPAIIFRATSDIEYEVRLFAGESQPNSGAFTGDVKISLEGVYGSTKPKLLMPDDGGDSFAPGAIASATITGPDLGSMLKVNLFLSGTMAKAAGWRLEWVTVKKLSNGTEAQFIAERVITSSEIADGEPIILSKTLLNTDYKVRVTTTNLPDAAFDGEVFMQLGGSDGSSSVVTLVNGAGNRNFDAGATDEFVVNTDDVGAISNVILQIKRSSLAQEWHLACLEVVNMKSGSVCKFSYNGYLNQHNEVVQLWMTSLAEYQVTVHTSSKDDGVFDGKVFLKLGGVYGSSDEALLSSPELASIAGGYTPGSQYVFKLKMADLGLLSSVDLRLEATGSTSQWALDRLEVAKTSCEGKTACFYSRGLISAVAVKTLSAGTLYKYKATVTTCDEEAADFDGDVFVTLVGTEGDADEVQMASNGGTPAMARDSTNEFEFQSFELGRITSIRVRTAKTGSEENWKLFGLTLTNLDTNSTWVFYYSEWLYTSKAVELGLLTPAPYTIRLVTSDVKGNGTDGRVFISLLGAKGVTPEQQVPVADYEHELLYERGQTDTFELTAPNVGELKGVTVRLAAPDSGVLHSGWQFSELSVSLSGKEIAFSNMAWLMRNDGLSVTLLTPEAEAKRAAKEAGEPFPPPPPNLELQPEPEAEAAKDPEPEPEPEPAKDPEPEPEPEATEDLEPEPAPEAGPAPSNYTCKILTSKAEGVRFDGDVYLTLICEDGESEEVVFRAPYSTPGGELVVMDSGSTIEETFQAVEHGSIESVRVRTEGGSGEEERHWKLEGIYLYNGDTDTSSIFYLNDWLAVPGTQVLKKRPEVAYSMALVVGDVKGSLEGCKAQVHLASIECEAWFLQRDWILSASDEDTAQLYEPGSEVVFTRQGIQIGGIESVTVDFQVPDSDPSRECGWLFNKLTVQVGDTVAVFSNDKWLESTAPSVTLTRVELAAPSFTSSRAESTAPSVMSTPAAEDAQSAAAATDVFDDMTTGGRDAMNDDF